MSSFSRVLGINYMNAKVYHRGIYDKIKPIDSICIICNTRNNYIRLNTCCYSCFETKLKNIVKINTKPKKLFSLNFIKNM